MVKKKRDMDERHALPVEDPEEAIRALMQVDPDAEPVEEEGPPPPQGPR
jgi:hypothetical protein